MVLVVACEFLWEKLVHISCDFRCYCMLKKWMANGTIWKHFSILEFVMIFNIV